MSCSGNCNGELCQSVYLGLKDWVTEACTVLGIRSQPPGL